ncbi:MULTISPECIES: hypothetical protein [unclassified Nostoc]|uniref:hypothetical protein n=1 Tax=unclassified Nostoc TaxID=2593658 RepID=UPI0025E051F2|nr:hypothetical protein [Nostoc sp. JL31]MBN3888504.1 hypothetical protein [Nostoc sp. JL31]
MLTTDEKQNPRQLLRSRGSVVFNSDKSGYGQKYHGFHLKLTQLMAVQLYLIPLGLRIFVATVLKVKRSLTKNWDGERWRN